jgi:RNA polymerase sigma-B factor
VPRDAHPTDEWLLRRYRDRGDRGAREQLTARLMPLAEHVARQYRHPRHEADLLQAAAYGLAKAIDGWDERHGRTLRTYAVPTMHGEVKRWLRDNAWPLHLPRRVREDALAVMRATERLTASAGHAPTVGQLGAELGLADEAVPEARLAAGLFHWVSFDAPVASTDGGTRLGDVLGGPDERLDRADHMAELRGLRVHLREQERTALRLRFVEDLTQTEIARRMGCSQMQVSRILRRALDRLHAAVEPSVP